MFNERKWESNPELDPDLRNGFGMEATANTASSTIVDARSLQGTPTSDPTTLPESALNATVHLGGNTQASAPHGVPRSRGPLARPDGGTASQSDRPVQAATVSAGVSGKDSNASTTTGSTGRRRSIRINMESTVSRAPVRHNR